MSVLCQFYVGFMSVWQQNLDLQLTYKQWLIYLTMSDVSIKRKIECIDNKNTC